MAYEPYTYNPCTRVIRMSEVLSLRRSSGDKFYAIYEGDIYKFKYSNKKGGIYKIFNLTNPGAQVDYIVVSKLDRITNEYDTNRFDLKTVLRVLLEIRRCPYSNTERLLRDDLRSLKEEISGNRKYNNVVPEKYFTKTQKMIDDYFQ